MNEVIIRLVPLPSRVKGFVREDPAGDYNVYIREQDPPDVQRETYRHELGHIRGGHLSAEEWTPGMEAEAEAQIKKCPEG